MKPLRIGSVLLLVTALVAGCGKNAGPAGTATASPGTAPSSSTQETAIRTAIQTHLAHKDNLNVQAFETDVKQVTINGDHAQAQVDFHVKGGGPGAMQMTYTLERRDNVWSVVESAPAGTDFSHPPVGAQGPQAGGTGAPADPLSDPTRFFKDGTSSQAAPHK